MPDWQPFCELSGSIRFRRATSAGAIARAAHARYWYSASTSWRESATRRSSRARANRAPGIRLQGSHLFLQQAPLAAPLAIRAAHLLHLSGEKRASPGSNCRELRTGQREWADGVALKDERPPVIGIRMRPAHPLPRPALSTTTSPGCTLVHGPGRAETAFRAAATSA